MYIIIPGFYLVLNFKYNYLFYMLQACDAKAGIIVVSITMLICYTLATVTISGSPLLQKLSSNWTRDVANGPCCIMPICVNTTQCYQTISCGYLCTKKEFALR